jgi:DNA-binding transcriptional LysR family regulator
MTQTDLRGVDLNLLLLLEALLATGSVTRAGDRLDLSQPAASRALARLRRTFGDPLFVRATGGLTPTRRAEALRSPLAQALAAVRAVVAPSTFDPARATGAVRLIVPDQDAAALAPRLVATVAAAAPELDVAFLPRRGDPLAALAADDADLALGVFPTAPAGFRRQRLYSDTMVCVVRRGHPVLARGLTLQRFVQLRHALITITGEGGGVVDAALAARGLARRIALRIPSFLAAPLVVARSDLIVTMPRRAAAEIAATLPIVVVEPPLPLPGFDVSQLWHERQHADPRHAWLRRIVASIAPASPGAGGGRARTPAGARTARD